MPWPSEGIARGDVRLRLWRPDDLAGFSALYDPEAARWSPPMDLSSERLAKRLEHQVSQAEAGEPPTAWAVVAAADPAQVLGSLDVRPGPPPPFSFCDIGYTVLAAARGRGVGSAALDLLTGWLLDPDGGGYLRVQLDHAVENVASCRTAARAGFAVEGVRTRYLPLKAAPDAPLVHHDVCLHGRVRATTAERPTG